MSRDRRHRPSSFPHAVVAFALAFSPLVPGAEDDGETFEWGGSYPASLARALERGRAILVYFPPVEVEREPPVLALAAAALGSPPMVEGVRARSDEVVSLIARFSVEKLPALILVDRRENVIGRWEGVIPAGVWRDVARSLRALARRDGDFSRSLAEARRLEADGKLEEAYRRVKSLGRSPTCPPDVLEGVRGIERALLDLLRRRILSILAGEGIVPDGEVIRELGAVAAGTEVSSIRSEVDDEIRRLRRGSIGARRR